MLAEQLRGRRSCTAAAAEIAEVELVQNDRVLKRELALGQPVQDVARSVGVDLREMELPAILSSIYFFASGPNRGELVPLVFAGIWMLHYGNRGWVFPFLIRSARAGKVQLQHQRRHRRLASDLHARLPQRDLFLDPRHPIHKGLAQ